MVPKVFLAEDPAADAVWSAVLAAEFTGVVGVEGPDGLECVDDVDDDDSADDTLALSSGDA